MLKPLPTQLREVDSRTTDGIEVRMLWSEHDRRVIVAVHDAKTGHAFSLVVGERDSAAHVFAHPYAHAAWRGIQPRPAHDATGSVSALVAA